MLRTPSFGSSLRFFLQVSAVSCFMVGLWTTNGYPDAGAAHPHDSRTGGKHEQSQGYTLLPNHRVIYGVVESVAEDHAKVKHGEVGKMSPRYLSLERAKEKGFTLKAGDRVEIVVNDKNHVVDYHLANGAETSDHRIIKGKLAQPMNVGQEHAIITTEEGKEESFPVRPFARSEVAAIPLDTEGLFLIDETNKIASAALMQEVESEYEDGEFGWARTTPKGVYHRVEGVIEGKPSAQEVIIRTTLNEKLTLPVWDYLKEDLEKLSEGTQVTVLVDHQDKIVNIAFSEEEEMSKK